MRFPELRPLLGLALGSALMVTPPTTTGPARGALVLVGGGANRPSFIQKFVALAGGPTAAIVLIPTTLEDDRLTADGLDRLKPYYDLSPGQRFDLTNRVVTPTPALAVHQEGHSPD